MNLKISDKYVVLSNLRKWNKWKSIKKSYNNNKFKVSAPTWHKEFELLDVSYFVSEIQNYIECRKYQEEKTVKPSIRIYMNNIESRVTSEI